MILESTLDAFTLLVTLDNDLWQVIAVSLGVSIQALVYASIPAILLAWLLVFTRFWGRSVVIVVIHSLLATPTVVIGLLLYLLLSKQGALGDLHLLFTQKAMIIGQAFLCFPLVTALTMSAFRSLDKRLEETLLTLHAGIIARFIYMTIEIKDGILNALLTGFGRVIAEIGISLMVGGNILNHTRNITTTIALETSKGNFSQAIALGLVLLALSLIISIVTTRLQNR